MRIRLVGLPENHDVQNVTRVWFPTPSTLCYTLPDTNYVFHLSTRDVEEILPG